MGKVLDMQRPTKEEHDPYFRPYVDSVQGEDVLHTLEGQIEEAERRFGGLDETRAMHRYAPGKWSVKDVLLHVTDADRIFATRVLRLARGETLEQPGFDHDRFVQMADADQRSIAEITEEFVQVRRANLLLYRSLPEKTHAVAGLANGLRVTVRMFPWLCAGHVQHHFGVLTDRYEVQ